jgi:hypothetical protein
MVHENENWYSSLTGWTFDLLRDDELALRLILALRIYRWPWVWHQSGSRSCSEVADSSNIPLASTQSTLLHFVNLLDGSLMLIHGCQEDCLDLETDKIATVNIPVR